MRQEKGRCSIQYEPCDDQSFRIGPMRRVGMQSGVGTQGGVGGTPGGGGIRPGTVGSASGSSGEKISLIKLRRFLN